MYKLIENSKAQVEIAISVVCAQNMMLVEYAKRSRRIDRQRSVVRTYSHCAHSIMLLTTVLCVKSQERSLQSWALTLSAAAATARK